MLNARIKIAKSVDNIFTHYIYKYTGMESSDDIEEYINHQKPIAIIKEKDARPYDMPFTDYEMARNDNPNEAGYIQFYCAFEFIYQNNDLIINLKNENLGAAYQKIKVHFTSTQTINKIIIYELQSDNKYKVINEISDEAQINNLFIIKGYNTFLIEKTLIPCQKVTFDFTIKVVEFIDTNSTGLFKPIIKVIEGEDIIVLCQEKDNMYNYYEYRVISRDTAGNLTPLSVPGGVTIKEKAEDVTQILQSCENYFYLNATKKWTDEQTKLCSEEFIINKNSMFSTEVPTLLPSEFKLDDSQVISNNIRYIDLPNIWYKDKAYLFERYKKAYRIKNKLKNESTGYSNIITFDGTMTVYIDRIIIYKKDVTDMADQYKNLPIDSSTEGAEILKIYIRDGGIYHKQYEISGIDPDIEQYITVVGLNSRYPILTIKDNCMFSKWYNYTVYFYDEHEKVSEPIVIVKKGDVE